MDSDRGVFERLLSQTKREAYPEAIEQDHSDFTALTGGEVPEAHTEAKALTTR